MNIRLALMLFAFSLLAPLPALAAGDHYVGLGLGALNLGNGLNKQAAFGGYLQIGHHFSEYLGAEVRIGATANASVSSPKAAKERMDFVAHYLKPQVAITSEWTGYGLIGFAVTHSSYKENTGAKLTKNRIGIAYGLGLDYQYSDDYSAGIEWSHMLTKPKNTAAGIGKNFLGLEASAFTAAIRYHF